MRPLPNLPKPLPNLHTDLNRTTAKHGLTGAELKRFNDAIYFFKKLGLWKRLWLVTTQKGASRCLIGDVQKRVTKLQRRYGLPTYNVTVLETDGGTHAHIVFVGNAEVAKRLRASALFGDVIDVRVADHPEGLSKDYLAKERTPQAGYGRTDLGRRRKGSHRLLGGGDRVRLSRDLERDGISANYIDDWQRSNARRSDSRKLYRLRGTGPLARAPRTAGQLFLLPEIERLPSRLRDFGGGYVPAAVALEIEFRRRQLGLSQREVATLIGRSQGQVANAIRGHDPIAGAVVNRLRNLLAEGLKRRNQQRNSNKSAGW
jgi:hypothetical protein